MISSYSQIVPARPKLMPDAFLAGWRRFSTASTGPTARPTVQR